jgi:diguanylate cyclase (GGDEF)-like protein/PAS domain S-box-containing protein
LSKESLVVVEDERIIAIDLKRRLERYGYRVLGIGSNGKEAIDLADEHRPDAVLMDIMLGSEMGGIEAATIIHDRFQIPIIFITAYSDEQTLEKAKSAEPYGYILKPFKEKELYTTIDISLYKFRSEKKIQEQRLWFSSILNSLEEGVVAFNEKNEITFMNPTAQAITGWTIDEIEDDHSKVLKLSDEGSGKEVTLPLGAEQGSATVFFQNILLESRSGVLTQIEGSMVSITGNRKNTIGKVFTFRDITEMKRMYDTIHYQATHDPLTGLANRSGFSTKLSDLLDNSKDRSSAHAMLYLDIDQFKIVNDTVGHAAGDELLLQTTRILKQVFRNGDYCARLGGDEFAVLLEHTSHDIALKIATRLQKTIHGTKFDWEGKNYNLSASIALVPVNSESGDANAVLAAADDACYVAKDKGGNRVEVYETEKSTFEQRRGEMHWIAKITEALEEDRYVLYFQHIQPIKPGEAFPPKVEVLIRMLDKQNRLIMPMDFIPAAERYNLSPSLDKWIIISALKNFQSKLDAYKDKNYVFSLNISGATMMDEGFLSFIQESLDVFKIPPEHVSFEITETAAIRNMNTAASFITSLKKLGCTFALDDFGKGFSSLSYLKNLPVDYLKIDGSFVKDMHTDPVNRAMVEAINTLAHTIGVKTVAEFVSSKEIYQILKEIGVDYAQGYYINKPEPLDEFNP